MLRPQHLFPDGQGPLVERLHLGVLSLRIVQRCQIVEAGGHVRVLRPQHLFPDGQGPLVEWFHLGVLSLRIVQLCQIVEALANDVFSISELFCQLEGRPQGVLGLRIATQLPRFPSGKVVLLPELPFPGVNPQNLHNLVLTFCSCQILCRFSIVVSCLDIGTCIE